MAEDYLKKQGAPYLWNDDRVIKDIEKSTWLDTAFPDEEARKAFIRRMHDLENRRTIPTKGQRDSMIKYIGELLNNSKIPDDFKQSLQKTNENLNKIASYPTKAEFKQSLKDAKDKEAKIRDFQKTQYFNAYPNNMPVRVADAIDNKVGILGEHTNKPTEIRSTSPDVPDKVSYKNMLLNAVNKAGRAVGESTVGALTDAVRKPFGAPLQHTKAFVNGTVPMLAGVGASLFWPNEYFKKIAEAKQGVLNQNNPLTYTNTYSNPAENALLSRYKKAVDPILDYTIPDIRKNGYYGKDPVNIRNLVDGNSQTPLLEKFKENIIPFLEQADAKLEAAGIPVEERYKYLTRQMESGEIQNFILRDLLGFRSKEENAEAIENYIKSKGLDDETADALRNLGGKYAENFNSDINLYPPLIRETPDGGFDVSAFYNNYNDFVKTSKNKGLAFTEGLEEGGYTGAGLGAITGLLTGKGLGGKLKSAFGHALSGGAIGGLTSGTIDATMANFFTDNVLSNLFPQDTYQTIANSQYLINTGNMNALPQDTNLNTNNWDQNSWKERLGWKEPIIQEAPNKENSGEATEGEGTEDDEFKYLTDI